MVIDYKQATNECPLPPPFTSAADEAKERDTVLVVFFLAVVATEITMSVLEVCK